MSKNDISQCRNMNIGCTAMFTRHNARESAMLGSGQIQGMEVPVRRLPEKTKALTLGWRKDNGLVPPSRPWICPLANMALSHDIASGGHGCESV